MAAQPVQSPSSFDRGISTFMQCFKRPAIDLFTTHLKSHPKHFECLLYRGLSFSILGEKDNAVADFTQAESCGTPCEKMIAQALRLRTQDRSREASDVLEQATKLHPRDPIAWHFYGITRYNEELTDDTTTSALKRAIDLGYRRSGVTRHILGSILASNGKRSEAIGHLRAGIAVNPTCTITYIALADSLLQTGSHEEAKQHYLRAIELNHTQIAANLGLVKVYLQERNYEAAAVQAAIYIEARYPKSSRDRQSHQSAGSASSGRSDGGRGGGEGREGGGRRGGGGGGGGRGGGGGGNGSDDDFASQGKKWKEIKKEASEKGEHHGIYYYKITMDDEDKWVSLDTARHAGSAFKVWTDKKSAIEFESSYDADLNKMEGKHDSNEGNSIKKCDLNIKQLKKKN